MPEASKHRALHEDVKRAEIIVKKADPYLANRTGELRRSHGALELYARSLHADAKNLRDRLTTLAQAEEVDSLRAAINTARGEVREGGTINALTAARLYERARDTLDLIDAANPQGKV